jgi:hypothetical protein
MWIFADSTPLIKQGTKAGPPFWTHPQWSQEATVSGAGDLDVRGEATAGGCLEHIVLGLRNNPPASGGATSSLIVIWNFNEIATGKEAAREEYWSTAMALFPEFMGLVQKWPRAFVLVAGSTKVWPKVKSPYQYDTRAAEIHLRLQSAGIFASRGIGLYESLIRPDDDKWHVTGDPQNLRTWAEWLIDAQAFMKMSEGMRTPSLLRWSWTSWLTRGCQPFLDSTSHRLDDEVLRNKWFALLRELPQNEIPRVATECNATSENPTATGKGAARFFGWLSSPHPDPIGAVS